MPDFKVLRGTAVIPSGTTALTLVNGVDYTLETGIAADAWFFQIANSRLTGMGRTASGGNQNSDDVTVSLSHVGNNTILTRDGSANNCRVDWQIVQYTGSADGPNEIKVREKGVASGATATATVALPGSVSEAADVVPFVTGQRNNGTGRGNYNRGFFTSEISGGNAVFDRFTTVSTFTLSYALVEFVGSNWTVTNEQFDNPSVSANTDQAVDLATAISDPSKTFLHCTYRYETTGTVGLDDASVRVRLLSATQLSVLDATATDDTLKKHSVWLIENPELNVARYAGTMVGTGEEEVFDVAVTEVASIDRAFTTLSNDSTGGGTAFPRGLINHILLDASTVRLRQSDNGQTSDYSIEVVELPEGSAGSPPAIAADGSTHSHSASAPSVSAGATAAPSDAISDHSASSPGVAANAALAPSGSLHNHDAGSPSLSVGVSIAPVDSVHDQAASSPSITTAATVAAQDAIHDQVAKAPSVASRSSLALAGALHDHAAGSPSLSVAGSIAANDSEHGHEAGSPSIVATSSITPENAEHLQLASAPTVSTGAQIAVGDAVHSHVADQPATGVSGQLDPADAVHSHIASGPSIAPASSLAPEGSVHAQGASGPALAFSATVTVQGADHDQAASSPSVTYVESVAIDAALHSFGSTAPALAPSSSLASEASRHDHAAGSPAIAPASTVAPQSAGHLSIADQPIVAEGDPLVPHIYFSVGPKGTSFGVEAQARSLKVDREDRAFQLPPAPRSFSVPVQSRTFVVPEEARP